MNNKAKIFSVVAVSAALLTTPAMAQHFGGHGGHFGGGFHGGAFHGGWHGGHGGWHGGGWGGIGLGFGTGLAIGSALAYPGYAYDYYDDGYYAPPVYAAPQADSTGYCMQRFKSYDPASGTYLGYDGQRHPCP